MLQMRENPQGGCPAGVEHPNENAVLRAKKIMIHAVNEAMAPALELLSCGGCDELIDVLAKEIVRSASFYALGLSDTLKELHKLG